MNTWQKSRKRDEKLSDTILGKKAEKAVCLFFEQSDFLGSVRAYDTFRKDNFKQHNNLDLVLCLNNEKTEDIQNLLAHELKNRKNITADTLISLRAMLGITVEIKSTRIAERHLNKDNTLNLDQVLKDDFLAYPVYLRTTTTIQTTQEYFRHVAFTTGKSEEQILQDERKSINDVQIRVYIDNANQKAYIIGGISAQSFTKKMIVKKMIQPGKSEQALYFAVPLEQGTSMTTIVSELNKKITPQNSKISP